MFLIIESDQEESRICSGEKTTALVEGKNSKWKVGSNIDFWRGDPRNKNEKNTAKEFATGKVSGYSKIKICHDTISLQKIGFLYVDGFKYSRSEAYRFAVGNGFANENDLFKTCNYEWEGKLISWEKPDFK
jgi:hypothetical protein